MMRLAVLLTILAAVATAVPAVAAAAPSPRPTGAMGMRKTPPSAFLNSANRKHKPASMSGRGCTSGTLSMRAHLAVNPITGKPQAAPIVSVPLSKGGGSVAAATTRAQQAHACAHAH